MMKKWCQKGYMKVMNFFTSERGDGNAVNWVVVTCASVVLSVLVFVTFKTQIVSFIKDHIFANMNKIS